MILLTIDVVAPDISLADLSLPRVTKEQMSINEKIGTGGYADVFKGKMADSPVAVKQILIDEEMTILELNYREFRNEVCTHATITHPYCVNLLAICFDPVSLVIEYINLGTLSNLLHEESAYLSWVVRISMLTNICNALEYIHSLDYAHLDFKSPNILVNLDEDKKYIAKLADFGTTRVCSGTLKGRLVDNPIWLAPEILRNDDYDKRVDIYALGIVCCEIMTRVKPFKDARFFSNIQDRVLAGERPRVKRHYGPSIYRELTYALWV